MDATPKYMLGKRFDLPGIGIAETWREWGYREDQHHCVLVAFFESWNSMRERPMLHSYKMLAKVLHEHYAAAQFPPDARSNAFVYWLSGPNRRRLWSDCSSREVFDQRYLTQFGPLFEVSAWLRDYHRDPEQAIADLRQQMQRRDQQDQQNPSRQGQRTDLVDKENCDINEVHRPTGTSVDAALRRLRNQRPDLHARVLNAELSAHAAMIEAGFRKPLPPDLMPGLRKLRRAWRHARDDEKATFRVEIGVS